MSVEENWKFDKTKKKFKNSLKIFKNFLIKDQTFQNSKNRPTERHNHAKNNKKRNK